MGEIKEDLLYLLEGMQVDEWHSESSGDGHFTIEIKCQNPKVSWTPEGGVSIRGKKVSFKKGENVKVGGIDVVIGCDKTIEVIE